MRELKDFKEHLALVYVVVLNLIVKGVFLSSNSLAGDEPFSVYHAQLDLVSIANILSTGNNPPLYEIILHFWINFFGISEFAVRLPSLVFNTINAVFVYKIGVVFFSKRTAIVASILFLFSNYQIVFAHEARVYSLFGMLTAISFYYYLSITSLNKASKFKKWILLMLVNILILYSHYFGFFVVFIQFVSILFINDLRKRYWKYLLYSFGILFLAYLPNILVFLKRLLESSASGTWLSPPSGIVSLYNMLWKFSNAPVVTVVVITILFSAVVKYIFFERKKVNVSTEVKILIIWFLFPFLFMFTISYWIPMFLDRYLIFITVPFYLIIAVASGYLVNHRKASNIIPLIVCVLFCVTVEPNISNKRNVEEAVEEIKQLQRANSIVLFCPHHFYLTFLYHYDIEVFKDPITNNLNRNMNNQRVYGINSVLDVDLDGWDHILYLDAGANLAFPNNQILETLNKDFSLIHTSEHYEIFKIYEFSRGQ